ncbi:hypothetical protein C8T65DRAFT_37836 [Cerioporus squamosus]|nr:hypothetical protein C8T65DRAFT_37836 [Cerioporus squamosus]
MESHTFPPEICEFIIDACAGCPPTGSLREDCYETLVLCSLVCKDWMARSRRDLYRRVEVSRARHWDLFVRTLEANPELGSFVEELRVSPGSMTETDRIMREQLRADAHAPPFSYGFLPRIFPSLRALHLGLAWRAFPPQHRRLITHFPIEELHLGRWSEYRPVLFHLIWSIRNLRFLTIVSTMNRALPEAAYERLSHHSKIRACMPLERLSLDFAVRALRRRRVVYIIDM